MPKTTTVTTTVNKKNSNNRAQPQKPRTAGKPAAPKRRRRQRTRKAKAFGAPSYRPLANIQADLMQGLPSRNRGLNHAKSYLSCRMNPFNATNAQGIPDGSNAQYLPIDNLMFDDISCVTNSGFLIQTIPTLPVSAMIKGLGAPGINDININGVPYSNSGMSSSGNSAGFYPISILNNFKNQTIQPGLAFLDPYNSTTARLVSCGYRLVYTGQSQSCSGTVTVSHNSVAFKESGEISSPGPLITANNITGVNLDPSISVISQAVVGSTILNADFNLIGNVYTKDSVIFRPEQGLMILPRHRSKDFKIIPTTDVPYFATGNMSLTPSVGTSLPSLYTSPNLGITAGTSSMVAPIWYDNDWSGMQVTVTGMQVGATFRWEAVWCMEWVPSASSAYSAFTRKESPLDLKQIDVAQKMVNSAPAGEPHFL